MVEVPTGEGQQTSARNVEGVHRERQLDGRRSGRGEAPDAMGEAIDHTHPDRGLLMPLDLRDGPINARGHVAKIVAADRADKKIPRDGSVGASGLYRIVPAIRGDHQAPKGLRRTAAEFESAIAEGYAVDGIRIFLDLRLRGGRNQNVRRVLPL